MGMWSWMRRRLDVLLNKQSVENELDDEIRFHLEMEMREHLRSGVEPGEARRRAMVAFGGVERFKEEVRDVRGARWVDDLRQDASLAFRSFPRQPAFLFAVLLTLGIGIGGNVAMFAVLEDSMFATLPYRDPGRLVMGRSTFNDGERLGPVVSGYDYFDYREQTSTLESLGAIAPFPQRVTVRRGSEAERVDGVWVSTDFFQALGVAPVLGRGFEPAEGEPGGPSVALLEQGYWQRSFGGDPSAVGGTLILNGVAHTVVGVLPARARFAVDADVWLPFHRGESWAGSRSAHNFLLVGRLSPGVDLTSAQAEVDGISARLAEAYPESNRGKGLLLTPLRETLVETYRSTLTLLGAAVVLLLVVACANVAGLLLARGGARRGELAVRSVMGADRGRLARQLMTENTILALAAGALGLLLAVGIERGILAFVSMDRLGELSPGLPPSAALFAFALSLATVALFGAVPSLRAARRAPAEDLRSAGRVSSGRRSARLRGGLVIGQVAFTVVLLSVAGLLLRSLEKLRSVGLGFDADDLLTAEVDLPASEYGKEARIAFYETLRERVASLPGVTSVGLASQLPVRDPGNNWGLGIPGEMEGADGRKFLAHQRTVMPGYFAAMEIPLLLGRDVEPSDRSEQLPAIVLAESSAKALFGDEDPLGRIVGVDGSSGPLPHQVVGVVGDVVMDDPSGGSPPAMYYAFHETTPTRMRLAVRFRDGADRLASGIRGALHDLDPGVPLDGVETLSSVLARRAADQRALAVLVSAFAAVAVLLAAVGLYGVLAYQVSRRVHEMGIRMALGASASTVTAAVVRGGLALVVVGLVLGLPAALFAGRLVRASLFGIDGWDPATFGAVALLLCAVGVVACTLPARRAARVDPTEAFRTE
jgi:putative ABC transport system permease protein